MTSTSFFRSLVLGSLCALLSAPVHAQPSKPIALVGGMLITGQNVAPIHNAVVVIQGDKIVQAGPAMRVKIPPDATVIDTSGKTMLPGLIDAHIHLILVGWGEEGGFFEWLKGHPEYPLKKVMELSAYQLLMSGVTSSIDVGGPAKESIELRDEINKGQVAGTRLIVSGPMISRNKYRGFPDDSSIAITSSQQGADEVNKLAKQGVDIIKAHSGLTREDYDAIVKAAHANNIKVHAHVYDEPAVRNAFETGVDVLQHVGSAGGPTYSPDLVKAIAAARRPVVPTVAHRAYLYPQTVDFPESLQDPELKSLFPVGMWKGLQESLTDWRNLGYFRAIISEMEYRDPLTKQWIESGAPVGMGTDNGTPMNFHTDALWREMKVFADLGRPALQVINDATRVNAQQIMGRQDLGTIEAGKIADIIVVPDNPLYDNLSDLGHVDTVIKAGVIYKQDGKPKFPMPLTK